MLRDGTVRLIKLLYPVESLNYINDLKPTGYFTLSTTNKHE